MILMITLTRPSLIVLSLLNSEMNRTRRWNTSSPEICCHATRWNLSVQLHKFPLARICCTSGSFSAELFALHVTFAKKVIFSSASVCSLAGLYINWFSQNSTGMVAHDRPKPREKHLILLVIRSTLCQVWVALGLRSGGRNQLPVSFRQPCI